MTQINLSMKRNRIMDIENRLVVAKGEEVGGGIEWEVGASRCKLLYIEWINNKVLLYTTENYIQYPMVNHNGKDIKKECIYICINESLCCTAVINTTLQINYNSILKKERILKNRSMPVFSIKSST